jgi:hypothetical protein
MIDLVAPSDHVVTSTGVAACDLAIEGRIIAAAGTFGSNLTWRLHGGALL